MSDDMHSRARNNVAVLTSYAYSVINGAQQQYDDAKIVADNILDDNHDYGAEDAIKDVTALWVNGASIWMRALLGQPRG